jgi:uncharacterized iron-regulated membrane protein
MRRWLVKLHLWSGLAAGVLLVLLGLTGSVLVFRPELEQYITRDWRQVEPAEARLPVDRWIELALQAVPGKVLTRVVLPGNDSDAPIVVVQTAGARNLEEAALVQVFVDPYRGVVLGVRDASSGFVDALQDFHYALFAGEPGLKFNGVLAATLLLLALSGPVLWWPGWRNRRLALHVHRRPAFMKWRDLHALSGLALAAVLALIAFTGLYYAYRSTATALIIAATGDAAAPPPRVAPSTDGEPAVARPLQQLWDAARDAEPAARFDELRPGRPPTGAASLSFRDPGDSVVGRNRLFVDPYSAQVLRVDRVRHQPTGSRLAANMGPWHFGSWGGRLTQWLWFVAGFAPAFLFATGAWMWWRRSVRPRQLVRAQVDGRRQVQ